MPNRGTYSFEVDEFGRVKNNPDNLERLRRLFLDHDIIDDQYGPGRQGDFDSGSWHILCHLVAGGIVYRRPTGEFVWVGITHKPAEDRYVATATTAAAGSPITTVPLYAQEGFNLISGAALAGYVEGSSQGHILARNASDPPTAFNRWPRQQYDQDADSERAGGTVWEFWCPTRDIRQSAPIGASVLESYLAVVSLAGGQYVAAVARGRRGHEHPAQLCGLVKAGFITREDALWDTQPVEIHPDAQNLYYEARPPDYLNATGMLNWPSRRRRYFMFERRIDRWSKTNEVREDLEEFGV